MDGLRLAEQAAGLTTPSARQVAQWVGLSPPVSLAEVIHRLREPGHFSPSANLFTFREGILDQLDVFGVAKGNGILKFSVQGTGNWGKAAVFPSVSPPAGAPMISAGVPSQVFVADANGVLVLLTPGSSSSSVVTTGDAHLTPGAWLEAFSDSDGEVDLGVRVLVVDATGALRAISMQTASTWSSVPISSPGFAPPGAPLARALRTLGSSLGFSPNGPANVFVVDNHGRLWVFEEENAQTQTWSSHLMPGNVGLVPGSSAATGYQVAIATQGLGHDDLGYSQLDVFAVDTRGQLQIWWESQGSGWTQVPMPNGSGLPPGAAMGVGYAQYDTPWQNTPIGNQLDVFVVDTNGKLQIWWVYQSGGWTHAPMPFNVILPPGAPLATGYQQFDSDTKPNQLDVFGVDTNGRIQVFWESYDGSWSNGVIPGS
jgi:hypothetical protein